MPVLLLVRAEMASNPRPHPARSKGAADVDVIAGLNLNLTPTTNLNILPALAIQDECVRSGLGCHQRVMCSIQRFVIQVNALLPGWHKTDLNRALLDGPLGDEICHKTPARRLRTADELDGAAIFLAPPASDFVTATTVVVDGVTQ